MQEAGNIFRRKKESFMNVVGWVVGRRMGKGCGCVVLCGFVIVWLCVSFGVWMARCRGSPACSAVWLFSGQFLVHLSEEDPVQRAPSITSYCCSSGFELTFFLFSY